jgi:hypothetical protein
VPLVAAFDAVLGVVGGDIGRHLLVAARGHFPAHLCGAVHDRLIVGGVWRIGFGVTRMEFVGVIPMVQGLSGAMLEACG